MVGFEGERGGSRGGGVQRGEGGGREGQRRSCGGPAEVLRRASGGGSSAAAKVGVFLLGQRPFSFKANSSRAKFYSGQVRLG